MSIIDLEAPTLTAGDNLSREEFLRLWEMNPEIKKAELIGGIVYMPCPLSVQHGDRESDVGIWCGVYRVHTPGTASGHNTTSFLLDDCPQPDVNLRILTEYGGASWLEDKYLAGSPEFLAEICLSSAAYDLHQKLDLYQSARVQEYLAILLYEKEIHWHVLENGTYTLLQPDPDGVWRSRVFPGLWLDGKAFFNGDMVQVLAKLQEGLDSAEHQEFVKLLAGRKKSEV